MQTLNSAQQRIVTENHNLIYSLANQKSINLDEYYDVLAIGLCKAAVIYDETKGKFSTLAYTAMYNEYKQELRKNSASKMIPQDKLLSIDVRIQSETDESSVSFADLIPDQNVCVEDEVFNNLMCQSLDHRLKDDEKQILSMLADGMNQSDIADKLNVSRQWISVKIKRIRNLLS